MSSEIYKLNHLSAIKERGYTLTERQIEFVERAEAEGFEVDYDYSGRFMNGTRCPSVYVSYLSDFKFAQRFFAYDDMGLGHVIYCPEFIQDGIRYGRGKWGMTCVGQMSNRTLNISSPVEIW